MNPSNPKKLKVLLVSMPWRETHLPNAGLGLLKAVLSEAGHEATVFDANLVFSSKLGDIYGAIAQYTFSEIAFAPLVYDDYPLEQAATRFQLRVAESLGGSAGQKNPEQTLEQAQQLPSRVAAITAELMDFIPWESYDLIGFSCTFNQTLASAAMARKLKERMPDKLIIAGGAACDGPMGKAMLEVFPWYDAAAVGRAELTVAPLCEALAAGRRSEPITGTVIRHADTLLDNSQRPQRAVLDELPIPDYDDFFQLAKQLGIRSPQPSVPMEASLGCWWGQKNLCTFCGLNATSLAFSQKSPERALREIRELGRRYNVDRIEFTDNILPLNYYDTLVPELAKLAEQGERYEFFVEIKTNAKRDQLERLRAAGFRYFQPGIESFSDNVLRLMRKGNTGISQVQFIRWCDEMEMSVVYNIIMGNPGEEIQDYADMAAMLPSLVHLTPPSVDPTMQLQRFSPYFDHPELHGIRNVRPERIYQDIFPGVDQERLSRLVYSFDYDHDEVNEPRLRATRRTVSWLIARWKSVHRPGLCTYHCGPDWVSIDDQREGAWFGTNARRWISLRGLNAGIYRFLDEARTPKQVAETFQVDEQEVMVLLENLVKKRLVYFDGKRALALAIRSQQHKAFATTLQRREMTHQSPEADLAWRPGKSHPRRQRNRKRTVIPISVAAS